MVGDLSCKDADLRREVTVSMLVPCLHFKSVSEANSQRTSLVWQAHNVRLKCLVCSLEVMLIGDSVIKDRCSTILGSISPVQSN